MDFVSFVPDYWDGPRHNRHFFCLELAKRHKVLFVSPPFSIEKILRRGSRHALSDSGTQQVARQLWIHVPPKFLFTNFRFPWLDRLFRRVRLHLLRQKMRRLGFRNPILLVWHPQYLEMLDEFAGIPSIYYIYDHLSGYTGADPKQRSPRELELIRRVDLVFVLSRKLLEENQSYAKDIVLLPNAVDFEHFSKARAPGTQVPEDLATIPRPRIGYVGSINEKVDIDLLEHMATKRPDWSIVLIGRQNFSSTAEKSKFNRLLEHSNVEWISYRNPDVLPAYLKGLDVCLMCYVINGWTYYGDPSKMHEYLAAGKPTVGAPLPSILEYRDVVEVPSSHDEWIDAVARSLDDVSEASRDRRIEVARANSYAERIDQALAVIEDRFGDRGVSD